MAGERLSALDASFLLAEGEGEPMSIGAIDLCAGPAPEYHQFADLIERRLHLLPRYRQRLAADPLRLGTPRWVDDGRFRLSYHLRHTALPAPGAIEQLQTLLTRIFERRLDRGRPLWELWLVEGVEGGRFALIHKMHHAIVDGVASIDVLNTIFDSDPDGHEGPAREPWEPQPGPSRLRLLTDAGLERAAPPQLVRSLGGLASAPRQALGKAAGALAGAAALGRSALDAAPETPYNAPVGPHRRFTAQRESLGDLKAVKDGLEGSLNDVVLAMVAGALGAHLRRRGHDTDGLELEVFVPVAMEASGETGNEVSGLKVSLPVGATDPLERFRRISREMDELKESAQVSGFRAGIDSSALAPPLVGDQVSRLAFAQRFVNLVVTNVPGPQKPLYLLGRELEEIQPFMPLAGNVGLGVAIVSYAGSVFFGFTADAEIVPDVGELPGFLHAALVELADAAGVAVAASAPAAEAPAAKRDREPWPGYDELSVVEIEKALEELDDEALAAVDDYERGHKDRKGVHRAVSSKVG